jgi:S-adenosylmethionine synthetase
VVPKDLLDERTVYDSRARVGFTDGGPPADCGLSGRKVVADTYGGWAHHGGGGLSGKDPSKIDRSATYMARYIAKNIVAAKVAQSCELQIAYAIGKTDPVSLNINMFGTGLVPSHQLINAIQEVFPLSPEDMISALSLRRPIYRQVGIYGHFGRVDPVFTWERTDKAQDLRAALGWKNEV